VKAVVQRRYPRGKLVVTLTAHDGAIAGLPEHTDA